MAVDVDVVLLDGSHDWLSHEATLLDPDDGLEPLKVHTLVRADQRCSSVAAASVLAKCERDALMVEHDHRSPGYGWAGNKGYGAPEHLEALVALCPSELHRMSWRLPGLEPSRRDGHRSAAPATGGASAVSPAGWSMMDG
jgi:ribonuclease HII